jgi:hypothetical protein
MVTETSREGRKLIRLNDFRQALESAMTNPVEGALSAAEDVTRRVKRWRGGDMRQQCCVARLMDTESRFRSSDQDIHRGLRPDCSPPAGK